jgi:hypothetical protein
MKPNAYRWNRRILRAALCGATLFEVAGCPLAETDFRAAALPAVESGITQIVNGLLDGVFAAIEPDGSRS